VLKKEKVYVPKNKELRIEIIWLYYDVLVAEHGNRLVTRNYWTKVPARKLKLSKILEKPWTYLIVKFITKLPLVAGKDIILVICNRLFKITHFVAIIEETLVEDLARLFKDNI